MQKKKFLFYFFMVIIFIFPTSFAADNVSIKLSIREDREYKIGENVIIDVLLDDISSTIQTFGVGINYDDKVLETGKINAKLANDMYNGTTPKNQIVIYYYGEKELEEENNSLGTILFKVKDTDKTKTNLSFTQLVYSTKNDESGKIELEDTLDIKIAGKSNEDVNDAEEEKTIKSSGESSNNTNTSNSSSSSQGSSSLGSSSSSSSSSKSSSTSSSSAGANSNSNVTSKSNSNNSKVENNTTKSLNSGEVSGNKETSNDNRSNSSDDKIIFEDVKSSNWYYESVNYVVSKGYFKGATQTTFAPNTAMTRGMLVTVLYRYSNATNEEKSTFEDVDENKYYSAPIAWAVENGIVTGVGNNKFAPDKEISRQDLATIIARYINKFNINVPDKNEEIKFNDEDKISNYAKDNILLLQTKGIMAGKGNNNFDPKGSSTRAEVATLLMRLDIE